MQRFYFFVKFDLVLIDILKIYRKKSSSILLRKNMFNSLLPFFFRKACTCSSFETFLFWKFRNYSQIYLSQIIDYWYSMLTLYITWGAFSLAFSPSFFLFFFRFNFIFHMFTENRHFRLICIAIVTNVIGWPEWIRKYLSII